MDISSTKAKLKWQCRRGMLELDLLLERFMAAQLADMDEQQCQKFAQLLTYSDPEIYSWLMGEQSAPSQELAEIVGWVKLHSQPR